MRYSEEDFLKLKASKEAADHSQGDMNRFQNNMIAHAKKLVSDIYGDSMMTMESEGFREIEDRISRHMVSLAMELSNIVYRQQVR